MRVLDDGRIPLDTKGVENAILPFCRGTQGLALFGHRARAQASAHLYSLIETAKRCGFDSVAYLRVVFRNLPRATTLDDIEALLPYKIDPQNLPEPSDFLDPH